MSSTPLITIEVPELAELHPAGEVIPLRLMLQHGRHEVGPVVIPTIRVADPNRITLDMDLFQRDVRLEPGETYTLTIGVRFLAPGPFDLNELQVQVNPLSDPTGNSNTIQPLPSRPLRIVPSLKRQLKVEAEPICTYGEGTKVEVEVAHVGETTWENFTVSIGPPGQVRAGITCHKRPTFAPGQKESFEVVIVGYGIDIVLSATADGQRVQDRQSLSIARGANQSIGHPSFTFLEPRALTRDRVTIRPDHTEVEEPVTDGVLRVRGGGSRYHVTIYPSKAEVTQVDLAGIPGKVDVGKGRKESGGWSFPVTVSQSPYLTDIHQLTYDMEAGSQKYQGELALEIRPSHGLWWKTAILVGGAITVRSLAEVGQALVNPDDLIRDVVERPRQLFARDITDWLQLGIIPIVRYGMQGVDGVWRWLIDW